MNYQTISIILAALDSYLKTLEPHTMYVAELSDLYVKVSTAKLQLERLSEKFLGTEQLIEEIRQEQKTWDSIGPYRHSYYLFNKCIELLEIFTQTNKV